MCVSRLRTLRARLALGRHHERIKILRPVDRLVHRPGLRPEMNPLLRLGQPPPSPPPKQLNSIFPLSRRAESPNDDSPGQSESASDALGQPPTKVPSPERAGEFFKAKLDIRSAQAEIRAVEFGKRRVSDVRSEAVITTRTLRKQ